MCVKSLSIGIREEMPELRGPSFLLCQFMHEPRTDHLQAVKGIFRYVKGTISHGLTLHLLIYTFELIVMLIGEAMTGGKRSTTGACLFFVPNLLAWSIRSLYRKSFSMFN